jgi:hypothetical protein
MANPEYHIRHALLFDRLAKVASDPDTADELLRLSAEHSAWARRGKSLAHGIIRPTRKAKRPKAA